MKKLLNTKYFAQDSVLVLLCFGIFVAYLYFLSSFSPRGISWLPYHYDRVHNAIENIRGGFPLLEIGLTSWDKFENYNFSSEVSLTGYITPITNYLLYLPLSYLWPDFLFVYGPLVDKIIIFITASAFSFYAASSFSSSYASKSANFLFLFTTLITSPWISRAFLAPYSEIFVFFYFSLFLVCIYQKQELAALIFFLLSMLSQHHWAFLAGVSIIVLRLLAPFSLSIKSICTPFSNQIFNNVLVLFAFVPSVITVFQRLYIQELPFPVAPSNTSFLFRVGVDSVHNFYFGGFLSAIQYLSSNRLTVCVSNSLQEVFSRQFYGIALYNCILLHLSIALFAVLAIYGFICLATENKCLRTSPANIIFFAALLFLLIFQQLWSTHLSGYTYSFGFIYSIGILGILNRITNLLPAGIAFRYLNSFVILMVLVPTSIRAFYLIGEFG